MGVVIALRAGQTNPLSWAQVDANFQNLAYAVNALPVPSGGTTAQRPTSPILYQFYFDTTLAQPIWCSSLTGPTWVNAAGVSV